MLSYLSCVDCRVPVRGVLFWWVVGCSSFVVCWFDVGRGLFGD